MLPKLLTVQEAAEALRLQPATIRAMLLRRRINSIRVGRAVRIAEAEVERVLREGLRPAKELLEKGGKYG
jgi:excisionase family DNA binding protein